MSKPPLWVIRVYEDKDADPDKFEDYPFTPGKFLLSETILVEEECNLTWPQVITGVGMWRASALRAVIWILRKRSNPKLKVHQVELDAGNIELLDPDDLPEYGKVTPADLEPEVTAEDPKDSGSSEPGSPETTTSPDQPESLGPESTNNGGAS
jgi:hypothetical protein